MGDFKFLKTVNRRTFLKALSITGAAGLIYPNKIIASLLPFSTLSRVIVVEDLRAVETPSRFIDRSIVDSMVNTGILNLTQKETPDEAWRTIFPGITPSKTIAIKVNCINRSLPSHPELAFSIAESIKNMKFGNQMFPENNIIIYDRTENELRNCGYTINAGTTGIRVFGTNRSGYTGSTFGVSGSNQKISNIIFNETNYLVNLAVLKSHTTAGLTLCLKNHYGTCDRPDRMHANHGDPYIAALNAIDPIATKQKINIIDGLLGIYIGGPSGSPQFVGNKIIMSTDIVAGDYTGRNILIDKGWRYNSRSTHIEAASSDYNLGTSDPAKMEVIEIDNQHVGIGTQERVNEKTCLVQNYPNPFTNSTTFKFFIKQNAEVNLMVFDNSGRQINTIVNKNLQSGWHTIEWNGKNDSGGIINSGIYIGRLITGNYQKSIIFSKL